MWNVVPLIHAVSSGVTTAIARLKGAEGRSASERNVSRAPLVKDFGAGLEDQREQVRALLNTNLIERSRLEDVLQLPNTSAAHRAAYVEIRQLEHSYDKLAENYGILTQRQNRARMAHRPKRRSRWRS